MLDIPSSRHSHRRHHLSRSKQGSESMEIDALRSQLSKLRRKAIRQIDQLVLTQDCITRVRARINTTQKRNGLAQH